jgi:hypothetical protein
MEFNIHSDKFSKSLKEFTNEIFVKCPHCYKKAFVLTKLGEFTNLFIPSESDTVFRCNNCFKPIDEKQWYGPIMISAANKNCGFCGTILTQKNNETIGLNTINIVCSNCNQAKEYEAINTRCYANSNLAIDPYFGLQLWLQISLDNNIFWAYNFNHLAYLKIYVSAKLRDEKGISKYSMTQKLPNFIKLAKNRSKIVKMIERLEKLDFVPS